MANREKTIECLVDNYKSKLMLLNNYRLAKEVFNNMNCTNCPLQSQECDCDIMDCYKNAYEFIEESEVEDGQ